MARRSGLGKGLGSLIPAGAPVEGGALDLGAYRELPVASITPNRHQPRAHFDEESLVALTASVREVGVIQPVLVRPSGDGSFELIAGERRWRAAKRAGLSMIPALVRDADELASVEQALVENLHREDLSPLEEAGAYQQLIEDFGLTHDELATRVGREPGGDHQHAAPVPAASGHPAARRRGPAVGRSRPSVARHARPWVSGGVGQAGRRRRAVGPRRRGGGARPAGSGGRSRRVRPSRRLRAPGVLELEELLSERLDTRVKVDMGARRGKVVIEFASLEDLERIYRAMIGGPRPEPSQNDARSEDEA